MHNRSQPEKRVVANQVSCNARYVWREENTRRNFFPYFLTFCTHSMLHFASFFNVARYGYFIFSWNEMKNKRLDMYIKKHKFFFHAWQKNIYTAPVSCYFFSYSGPRRCYHYSVSVAIAIALRFQIKRWFVFTHKYICI